MAVINRMAELHDEITAWRRDFHAHPELMYDVHRTADSVARKLKEFGCDEVVSGIGRTGVVGVIRGNHPGKGTIGLRADMDALPITEMTGLPHASTISGNMHACGHDGHTAMLLGAARYLAETRNFAGTVIVIFQPAEEGGAGGDAMVRDGLMERFGIEQVYGLHNLPGLDVGEFAICDGPIMASTDEFSITLTGKGCHAAMPHLGVDPIVAMSQLVTALQTIVSRNNNPQDSLVVSVTQFHAGNTNNVIPETAMINGTIRSLNAETRALGETRLRQILDGVTKATGTSFELEFSPGYPVTFNHAGPTETAIKVARLVSGDNKVDDKARPMMGGEDFSYMLKSRPGAYIFMGNGDTAGLHHPKYDFNDDAIPYGASFWAKLAETVLPISK
jgi:hippurate hydrolase